MIGPPSSGTIELEAVKMKRDLEGWREIVLPAHSILVWNRPCDPGIIFGATTFLFIIFWYLDPSVLSTVAAIGLITTVVDFLVPTLLSKMVQPNDWTATKEKQLEKICRSIALNKLTADRNFKLFMNLRSERPTVYYAVVIITLVVLTWLGNSVNNLLLTYIAVLAALLTPGLLHSGMLAPYLSPIGKLLSSIFNQAKSTKKTE